VIVTRTWISVYLNAKLLLNAAVDDKRKSGRRAIDKVTVLINSLDCNPSIYCIWKCIYLIYCLITVKC